MSEKFPAAVPEIPVSNLVQSLEYYRNCLGFSRDWGGEDGGIGQVSRGDCRLFLTDTAFRKASGFTGPSVIWLNLDNKQEVDDLYAAWESLGARLLSRPESKPWHLHEFTAADLDGNVLRVFYDFAWELPDRGGRKV
jgi:predicted lactoylglutathione lyase